MDHKEVLKRVDHTLLTQAATWEEVQAICDEGMACETASVCIPPRYVKRAADYVKNRLKICTVVGFPNGYSTPEVKVFETEDAIRNGADEIDMVMDIGLAKSGDWEGVLEEIKAVSMSGADFIKTSTGFASGGATVEDVALFREHISPDVRIKAAGGIRRAHQGRRRHPHL